MGVLKSNRCYQDSIPCGIMKKLLLKGFCGVDLRNGDGFARRTELRSSA